MAHPDIPSLEVNAVEFRVLPMRTRFPFQYGIASMTSLPHLFLKMRLSVAGSQAIGISSEGLPPKWFTKNPQTSFDEDLPDMLEVIRHATELACARPAASYFDLWMRLYEKQSEWAGRCEYPPLLANLGVSLVERAILDGMCRALRVPFAEALRRNRLGIRFKEIDPSLAGIAPVELLPKNPVTTIKVRHTVGLGDPLTDSDVTEPLADGLPHSLEASIRAYGLSYFKIKICGDLERDLQRMRRIREVLERECGPDYAFTLDGNEQFSGIGEFREHWEAFRSDETIAPMLNRTLFVEQPLHRDRALAEEVGDSLAGWRGAPPLIIDESEAALDSLPRALALGYSGTSHKNCKGILKGVLNAMRLERLRRADPGNRRILSGEDLANVGPVALLQDLAVMASLGISHLERNGHHYFRGLSAFPTEVQEKVLELHPGLYKRHPDGFPTLRINEGEIHVSSVVDAPFGPAFSLDLSAFETLDAWLAKV